MHGQDEDLDVGMLLLQLLCHLQAFHARQGDVHEDHVRLKPFDPLQSFQPLRCLARDLYVGLEGYKGAQSGPQDGVVVNDQHPDLLHCSKGTSTKTVVPSPGVDSIVSFPATRAARSSMPKSPSLLSFAP